MGDRGEADKARRLPVTWPEQRRGPGVRYPVTQVGVLLEGVITRIELSQVRRGPRKGVQRR